jgi:hypothetical protein
MAGSEHGAIRRSQQLPNHMMTTRRGVMPIYGLDCWLRPSVTLL